MRNFKRTVKVFFILCLGIFTAFTCFAQQLDQPDPCTDPDVYCPIDDYYPLLIAAVILFAAARAWKQSRKSIA